MNESSFIAPHTVAVFAFALGVVFGVVSNVTRFCTMGALADVVLSASWRRMGFWLAAMATALLGTSLLRLVGGLDVAATIYASSRLLWLSHLAGGALFGVGMVLASGCGARTLTRLGSGSLKAAVVMVVLALSALMTMRGALAPLRITVFDQAAVELPTSQDLPSLLAHAWPALGVGGWVVVMTLVLTVPVLLWLWRRTTDRRNLVLAALGIGGACAVGWLLTGYFAFVAEHPDTLEAAYIGTNSGRAESLTFVAPFAYGLDLLLFWTDSARLVTFGIASAAGVVAGAFGQAWMAGALRVEGFADRTDFMRHVVGAVLMGFGGVTALGCTIGQGVSGISVLSLGSFLTLAGIIAGAVFMLWLTLRRM